MPWETRRNRRYYYRKQRQPDGTVTSEYIGSGPIAELLAHTDELDRQEEAAQRAALAALRSRHRVIDQAVDSYRGRVREVVRRTLRAAGFHQHRGQWRLKREMAKLAKRATQAEHAAYNRLYGAAKDGPTPKALAALAEYAAAHPQIFDDAKTLGYITLERVVESCTEGQAGRIHLMAEVAALKRSLGYVGATAMEKLLIDDVAVCWVRLQATEQLYTQGHETAQGSGKLRYSNYLEGRLSATQRRYLRSLEGLARVRGLLSRIGVQVNIAGQQIVQNG